MKVLLSVVGQIAMIKAVIFDLGNTLIMGGERDREIKTLKYASEVLNQLKSKFKLAIITNVEHTTSFKDVKNVLKEAKILDFFDVIVVSSEIRVNKPNERIFQIALEKLDVKPEEAIMIGNTISTDIFGGNRIGMKTVLLQHSQGYQPSEWEKPNHTIHSLKELLNLLK
jgi:putative hydrolase of the HAD superfamily